MNQNQSSSSKYQLLDTLPIILRIYKFLLVPSYFHHFNEPKPIFTQLVSTFCEHYTPLLTFRNSHWFPARLNGAIFGVNQCWNNRVSCLMDLLPKMEWKQARDYSKSMSLRKLFFSDPHPLVTPKTIDDGRTRCITIKTRKETRFRRNMIFIQTKLLATKC